VTGAPDPQTRHPVAGFERTAFLKPFITRSNIEVGDYTYYDDPRGAERFEDENVLYHFSPDDVLKIGKYVAIATGATFIMNGANHPLGGPSTYPFPIFGAGWAEHRGLIESMPSRGGTTIGNDVWIGWRATIMPGATVGDGAIVASASVVAADVPPYAIVAGNPAKVVKMRFAPAEIERLLAAAWWNWPVEKVSRNIRAIMAGSVADIENAR